MPGLRARLPPHCPVQQEGFTRLYRNPVQQFWDSCWDTAQLSGVLASQGTTGLFGAREGFDHDLRITSATRPFQGRSARHSLRPAQMFLPLANVSNTLDCVAL